MAMNELMPENTPLHTDNSQESSIQYEIPSQIFDHSIPVIRNTHVITAPTITPGDSQFIIQIDGGANRSITNNANLLTNFRNIK
jgi:hypothetical protein